MPRAAVKQIILAIATLAALCGVLPCCHGQSALLMEEPYGFFGTLNPTGHTAIYFARICAESPVKVRRCRADENGSVIARYQGIAGYDWVAMPLLPYLYSVESAGAVPEQVDKKLVRRLRDQYHEQYLGALGQNVFEGNLVRGGWTQLVGVAYERRIFAFRFNTSEDQDKAIIERLNDNPNRSDFSLIYNNCADFARTVLNTYFPRTFRRTIFPDAGMTTPRQITWKLLKYARKHPEVELIVFEIPQVPGFRRMSRSNKSVAASLVTTGYAVPIAILNPYLAGGIVVDYLVRGRYPLVPDHPEVLTPGKIQALTTQVHGVETADDAGATPANQGLAGTLAMKEIVTTNEQHSAREPGPEASR